MNTLKFSCQSILVLAVMAYVFTTGEISVDLFFILFTEASFSKSPLSFWIAGLSFSTISSAFFLMQAKKSNLFIQYFPLNASLSQKISSFVKPTTDYEIRFILDQLFAYAVLLYIIKIFTYYTLGQQ